LGSSCKRGEMRCYKRGKVVSRYLLGGLQVFVGCTQLRNRKESVVIKEGPSMNPTVNVTTKIGIAGTNKSCLLSFSLARGQKHPVVEAAHILTAE
jgi:hypothetical protein